MSRFRWFKRHVETKSVSETSGIANPETFHFDLFGSMPLASGVSVNPTTAMQCSPVRCAVAAISEAVAQLPVHLYERGENGSRERAPDHPIAPLLKDAANEFTSSAALIERVTAEHGREAFTPTWLADRELLWAADLIPDLTNLEKSS